MKNRVKIHQHKKTQPPAAQPNTARVAYKAADPFAQQETVQRRIAQEVHNEPETTNIVKTYAASLDTAVDKSYRHVLSAPRLGVKIDGHTKKWVRDWKNHMKNGKDNLFAASFGYAVESLASNPYLPPAPGGYDLEIQGVRENTRPDVILIKDGIDIAWLDITASESEGHIWTKGPPFWRDQKHAVEIVYPSLTEGTIAMMESNDKNDAPQDFDKEAFEEKKSMMQLLAELREEERKWQKDHLQKKWRTQKKPIKNNNAPKLTKQAYSMFMLQDYFQFDLTEPIITYDNKKKYYGDDAVDKYETGDAKKFREDAPHILTALGLGSKTFGFIGGSKTRGIKLLQNYNKGMFQLEDLIDPCDRDDISSDDSEDTNVKKRKLTEEDKENDPQNKKKRRTNKDE